MKRSAWISSCGRYRYALDREWAEGKRLLFVMLNPSKADADLDDPTIRRCIDFAQRFGFGSLEVVNLFALKATDPAELRSAADPIGPCNRDAWRSAERRASKVMAAWGNSCGDISADQAKEARRFFDSMVCLGLNLDGSPKHPVRLSSGVKPMLYCREGLTALEALRH